MTVFSRRGALLAGSAFVLVPRTVRAQAGRKLAVGVTPPSASGWPYYVSQELGFFKRYNLDPQFITVESVAGIIQQTIANSLDISEVSSAAVVEAVQHGATTRYICEAISTPPYAFLAQKQYKKYADLKGKTVIIGGPADITVVFTERMLASAGLKMSDVDFSYAGATSDRYAALRSGSVAAAILFPPFSFRAQDDGYNMLGNTTDVMPPFPFGGWIVTDAYGQAHPDVVVDFCKGYLRGARWLGDPANRARAVQMLAKNTNLSPEYADKSYELLVLKAKAFPPTGVIAKRSFQTVVDSLTQIKLITGTPPDPATFYDNKYVSQANAQLSREPRTT
jgi:ABC-type nitrate/sulfonate/bicarbonate transport system substrate-binding protein